MREGFKWYGEFYLLDTLRKVIRPCLSVLERLVRHIITAICLRESCLRCFYGRKNTIRELSGRPPLYFRGQALLMGKDLYNALQCNKWRICKKKPTLRTSFQDILFAWFFNFVWICWLGRTKPLALLCYPGTTEQTKLRWKQNTPQWLEGYLQEHHIAKLTECFLFCSKFSSFIFILYFCTEPPSKGRFLVWKLLG